MKDVLDQFKSIELNTFDKIFVVGFTLFTVFLFFKGMTVLTFGGIVLIYGAFLTYKGQIFLAVASYLAADICWVINAIQSGDVQGAWSISLGILFGVLASYKMKTGKMKKDLLHEN